MVNKRYVNKITTYTNGVNNVPQKRPHQDGWRILQRVPEGWFEWRMMNPVYRANVICILYLCQDYFRRLVEQPGPQAALAPIPVSDQRHPNSESPGPRPTERKGNSKLWVLRWCALTFWIVLRCVLTFTLQWPVGISGLKWTADERKKCWWSLGAMLFFFSMTYRCVYVHRAQFVNNKQQTSRNAVKKEPFWF